MSNNKYVKLVESTLEEGVSSGLKPSKGFKAPRGSKVWEKWGKWKVEYKGKFVGDYDDKPEALRALELYLDDLKEDVDTEDTEEVSEAVVEGFDVAFDKWFKGATKIRDEYLKKNFPISYEQEELTFKKGKKYIKVIQRQKGAKLGSVWAFIDTTTGDVLKPASFSAPAKGARGNIYDAKGGLGRISAYGPGYNR